MRARAVTSQKGGTVASGHGFTSLAPLIQAPECDLDQFSPEIIDDNCLYLGSMRRPAKP